MKGELTESEMKILASQLGCPEGDLGLEVGDKLNETNKFMILDTIESLNLSKRNLVLELGQASGHFVKDVLEIASGISYVGLEISPLMRDLAEESNREYVNQNRAAFELYDGKNIRFSSYTFDKVFTVNTLYFWEDPAFLLGEIYRVLKPGGMCCIAFVQKQFMEKMPVTQYGFEFYDSERLEGLFQESDFRSLDILDRKDSFTDLKGESQDRNYSLACFTK
jgi:SAM-dependent methyltransferase